MNKLITITSITANLGVIREKLGEGKGRQSGAQMQELVREATDLLSKLLSRLDRSEHAEEARRRSKDIVRECDHIMAHSMAQQSADSVAFIIQYCSVLSKYVHGYKARDEQKGLAVLRADA